MTKLHFFDFLKKFYDAIFKYYSSCEILKYNTLNFFSLFFRCDSLSIVPFHSCWFSYALLFPCQVANFIISPLDQYFRRFMEKKRFPFLNLSYHSFVLFCYTKHYHLNGLTNGVRIFSWGFCLSFIFILNLLFFFLFFNNVISLWNAHLLCRKVLYCACQCSWLLVIFYCSVYRTCGWMVRYKITKKKKKRRFFWKDFIRFWKYSTRPPMKVRKKGWDIFRSSNFSCIQKKIPLSLEIIFLKKGFSK